MSIPKHVIRQRDFTGGQPNEAAMRRDDAPIIRAGARSLLNKRLMATGPHEQRPGFFMLDTGAVRTDEIEIEGTVYKFAFSAGELKVKSSDSATTHLTVASRPWVNNSVSRAVMAQYDNSIIITFPQMTPLVVTLNLTTGVWSSANFAFREQNGRRLTPFHRLSSLGITLRPSALTGTVDITFSDPVMLNASWIGTRLRYVGRQMTIATRTGDTTGTATVHERLFPSQRLLLATDPLEQFSVGELIEDSVTGDRGQIIAIGTNNSVVTAAAVVAGGTGYAVGDRLRVAGGTFTTAAEVLVATEAAGAITGLTVDVGGKYSVLPANPVTLTTLTGTGTGATANLTATSSTNTFDVVLLQHTPFTETSTGEIVGPNGHISITGQFAINPLATAIWDEEVINDFRGWPSSCFVDQRRLGFCDIPALRGSISWSAIDSPTDHHPDDDPNDALVEIVPGKERVYHVLPWDDELVFSERGVYYVPISETSPLIPGSVAFRPIVTQRPGTVRPIVTPQGVVYVTATRAQVIAITPTGQTAKSYLARDITELHSDLLGTPVCLASASSGLDFTERYVFIVNDDGTVVVGRYDQNKEWVGWVPWVKGGDGLVKWVSARDSRVLFNTLYQPDGATNLYVTERLDVDAYMDASVVKNEVPASMAPPSAAFGPLWFWGRGTVAVMYGQRYLGTRQVDAHGFIEEEEGENLPNAITVGQVWSEIYEPFIPHTGEGQSARQTLRRRRISRGAIKAVHSTGFVIRTFNGDAVTSERRVTAYGVSEDQELDPELREAVAQFTTLGRSHDPRIQIVKDIPGPCRIIEFSAEVGV